MIFPKYIKKGDTIGVTATSSSVPPAPPPSAAAPAAVRWA